MLHRTLRLTAFVTALATLFIVADCTSSGSNTTNSAANTSVANANTNAAATSAATGEAEISKLLDEYNEALLKKDAATLDRIWADDLSFVNPQGQILTKKDRMENIKTGATALEKAQVSEQKVRMYGDDTAVATLVVGIEGHYSGKEDDGSFRVTTVWAKPNGTWQMVSTQMTPIVK